MKCSFDATALVTHARLDASGHSCGDTSESTARYTTTEETATCNPFTASTDTSVRWRMQRITVVEVRMQRFERFTCVDCGFVTTRSKGATEDPAMCPHVETDTRGSSKTLVRHTCKACLKVILQFPRNEASVRESTAKDVSRERTHLHFMTSVARCM